jgi:predicted metal-dependent hydrolase
MISAKDFKKEVFRCAEEIAVKPKEVHLRDMNKKWASCSNKGRLSFSTSLLNEVPDFRNKVIVHELIHIKYPTHGKMFKTLFISYLRRQGIDCSLKDFNLSIGEENALNLAESVKNH